MAVPWKDAKLAAGVEEVRSQFKLADHEREDDAMIGMLVDRFQHDHEKVVEMYRKSLDRRKELGLAQIKEHIVTQQLKLDDFPHHAEVGRVIPIFASTSLERPKPPPGGEAGPSAARVPPVIGCYEMRYGQGSADDEAPVSPADFTKYMLYVTQWRWLQCEAYVQRHGELGFWSMVHDLSCPAGFLSVWSRARHVFREYMGPVEEACSGLFPPMVQKILIVNVPRLFSPVWSIISAFLPEAHKERIVLLSTSNTTAEELSKYMPYEHLPPHVLPAAETLPTPREGAPAPG